jgi:hypothetical protein
MKQRFRGWILIWVVLLPLFTGCASLEAMGAGRGPELVFDAAIAVSADELFKGSLSVHNAGDTEFGGDKRFDGEMTLRYAESGELRASASIIPLQAIAPGETVWPLAWEGELTPGEYILTWGAEGYGETEIKFEVVEHAGRLSLGSTSPAPEGSAEVEVEGGGSAMPDLYVARAVEDLAAREGAPEMDIRVVDVTRTEFSDASLGVPEPDMMYAQVLTPGYVIELALGDAAYTYHAAGERVVLVPAEGSGEQGSAAKQVVLIPEIGLSFAVPGDWQRLAPEFAWALDGAGEVRLGVAWADLQPPMEPEAVLLPNHAQVVSSESVDLGWAQGREVTLEVFAPAAEQGASEEPAPVVAVETYVLLVTVQQDRRLGIAFYSSAPTAEALAETLPMLDEVVASAAMAAPAAAAPAAPELPVEVPGDWQMLTVEGAGGADWRFRVSFPLDWTAHELNPLAGMPEDWPVASHVQLYPQSWAEHLQQSGPPDPNAPPTYIPLTVEVVVGPEASLRRVYVPPTSSETLDVNGLTVIREVEGSYEGLAPIRYVIRHPENPEVWLVLVDVISGFTERLEGNEAVADVIPVVVASVVVEQ